MYNVLKVIYFANKNHLSEYGKFIYDDSYAAMSHGAVPSMVYDMIKFIRDDEGIFCDDWKPLRESFIVEDEINLIPVRNVDLEYLSESDRKSLDESISQYGNLSFKKLKKISHDDTAYQKADMNDVIPMEAIIESLPNSGELIDYLSE